MAASYSKGITVDIGGNVQPLNKALNEATKNASGLNAELRVIDKLLKFDPTNTTLLTQKQKALAENISNTTKKLETLRGVQKQLEAQRDSGQIGADQYRAYERDVLQTENALKKLEAEAKEVEAAIARTGDESREAAEDISEFGDSADDAAKKADALGGKAVKVADKMNSIGSAMTKGVTAPIVAGMGAAINYATDLEETMSKVDVVFGDNADTIKTWADGAVKSMGLSKQTAMTAAAAYANMSDGMGLAKKEGMEMAMSVTQLSADLASFNNTSQETAQIALNGIWTGETEALKQYGVVMTETNLAEYAKQQGIKKTVAEMTQAEKVQLRYNYVLANTANAQGDFARTSDSVANQTRMAKEQLKEAAATLGQNLLPIVADVLSGVNGLLEGFNSLDEDTQKLILTIAGVGAAAGPVLKIGSKAVTGVLKLKDGLSGAMGKLQGFSATLTSTGGIIGMVVAGLGTLAAVVESIAGPSEEFKKLADEAKNLADSTEEAVESGKNELAVLKAQQKELPNLIDRLYQLNDAEKRTSSEQTELANLVTRLNQQYSGLGLAVDKSTGKLNLNRAELEKSADAIYEMAEAQARQEAYYESVQKQIDAEGNLALSIQKTRDAMLQGKEATEETKAQLEEYIMTLATSDERFAEVMDSANVWSADVVEGLKAVRDNASALDTATEANAYFAEGLDMTAVAAGEATAATDELTASTAALTEQDAVALMRRLAFGEQLNEADAANLEAWKETNADRAKVLEETVAREAKLQQERVDAATNANEKIQKSDQISLQKATENLQANTKLVKEYTTDMDFLYGKIPDIVYKHLEEAGVDQARLVSEMADSMREGGGKIANDYVAAYIDGLYQGKEPLAEAGYELGSSTMDSTGLGIAENAAATSEAGQQLQSMYSEMQNLIMADDMFTYLGRGIINQLTNGMRDMRSKLLDVASNIASQLKSKFNFSVSVSGTASGARIKAYDVGGYFKSPQIIQIAEKRPEFVGAADDLESFINKAVNNAFVGVNPILLQNVKLPRTAAQSGSVQVNVSMPISVSRSLTDSEIQQKARTITGVVQRELAKVTGGKVG